MAATNEEKALAARREADEKRFQEARRNGEALDQRMALLTRDDPRPPRPAEQRRGKR
jgi:hypothetical protein